MENEVVFSINKFESIPFPYPKQFDGKAKYDIVENPEGELRVLSYDCIEVQNCDLADPNVPCFVDIDQCNDWKSYQNLLGMGGDGGGGDGGGGGGDCSAPQCPCPGPAPICGSGVGCCCGENQFCSGSVLNQGVWSCASCNCIPGTTFGVGGGCINPWTTPGGYDGVGG